MKKPAPVTWQEIISQSRNKRVVDMRSAYCRLARQVAPEMTLRELGSYLGNRSPATIMHEINRSYQK